MASHKQSATARQQSIARESQRKACNTCKRRKVRCSGDAPCQNCLRHSISCEYTATHGRLAHAERRLQELQSRLEIFEETWSRYVPQVELSAAVRSTRSESIQTTTAVQDSPLSPNELDNTVNEDVPVTSANNGAPGSQIRSGSPSPADSEYEDADTLVWDESVPSSRAGDGFASLSTNWKGIGYMGPTTGNTLLRKLQSLSMLYLSAVGNPSVDRPLGPALPEFSLRTPTFTNQCVDWYFIYYHHIHPILHEGYFRAQLTGALPKPKDGSWPILLNVVLALGSFSGPSCNLNADLEFQRDASSHLSWNVLQRGTLSLVQALGLLANYLQKRDRPNSGFILLGIAMNMAQSVGLHRDLCGPATTPFTMEIRRRVWWTLFVFDAEFRLIFGRPTLCLGGVSTRLPRNLDDTDLAVDMTELLPARDRSTVTSTLIWQTGLAKISNAANEKLVAKHVPALPALLALGEEVCQWTRTLPEFIHADLSNTQLTISAAPRTMLIWRSIHLRTIIHRPYLLRQIRQRAPLDINSDSTAVSLCVNAADELTSSILRVWSNIDNCHGLFAWYSCYFLVTAVFVHISCLLYEPHNVLARHWRQHIEDSERVLEHIGSFESTSLLAARMLHKIMSLVPADADSTLFQTNEPIRMALAGMWNMSWDNMTLPMEPLPSEWLFDENSGIDNFPVYSQADNM